MSTVFVMAIRDLAVQSYLPPQFVPHVGGLVRSFTDLVNAKDTDLGKHPEDFELHKLGLFDSDSGVLTPTPVEVVVRGKDVLRPLQ